MKSCGCTCVCVSVCVVVCVCLRGSTCTPNHCTHTHTLTHTHSHTLTHTLSHIHTHTHTLTHAHVPHISYLLLCWYMFIYCCVVKCLFIVVVVKCCPLWHQHEQCSKLIIRKYNKGFHFNLMCGCTCVCVFVCVSCV